MSPRPRKASDQEVFAAAHRVMSRFAPAQCGLREIAAEAGLTAGALVQRFGSKRGLLVALARWVAADTPRMMASLRTPRRGPLDTIRAYADCMAQMGESPGGLAHHLAYLQLDFADPDLRRHLRAQALAARGAIQQLLEEAVAAGELRPATDTRALSRAVEVALSGSILTWGLYEQGTPSSWLRKDLAAVLAPYRAPRGRLAHARRRG